ncbi:hypothetical protein, partial [Bifidobacterium mongoliense]|uniref:hypothetical protein n=1 Tax=Bifidobacterium mongoliense TaxID=518643 RepID=UPI0030EE28E3
NVLGHGPHLLSNRFSLSAIENRTHRTGYAPTTSKLRKNPDVILQSTNYVYAQHVCFAFEDADHYAVRFFEKIELLHDLIVIGMMVYPEVEQVVGCLGERLITREFFSELGIETCGTIRVNYLRCLDCIIKVTTQKM